MLLIEPRRDRISRDIERLSTFIDPEDAGFTRISFSPHCFRATEHLAALMSGEAGLNVLTDAAGNLIGRRPGLLPGAPAIVIGSHIDSVRGGGRFDGTAGVVAGLELARLLEESGTSLRHPLEVVSFAAEEPSPFGISTVGSRAMAGKLRQEEVETLMDAGGRTLAEAIRESGGDPSSLEGRIRSAEEILVYLELHIEQGPVLEQEGVPVGIVSGIAGITRGSLEIAGRPDHAGTTPMDVRCDALAAAAEAILALERVCRTAGGVVGTVGRIDSFPNALNVVPGLVGLGLEVRSIEEERMSRVIEQFSLDLTRLEKSRGVEVRRRFVTSSKVVKFPEEIISLAARICEQLGLPYRVLPSGAGHDASHIAEVAPAGMIFVPSRGGRSHCPEEFTELEDIVKGIRLLGGLVGELDKR